MTSPQVVEMSVEVTNNSPSRDYSLPDDQTTHKIIIIIIIIAILIASFDVKFVLFSKLCSHWTLRSFPDGLVTLDVVQCANEANHELVLSESVRSFYSIKFS